MYTNALILAAAGLAAAQTTVTLVPVETATAVPTSLSTAVRNATVVTTTRVVNAYTTYCPFATTLEFNGKTYEVTEPTTLTILDCPCTVTETAPCSANATGIPPPPMGGSATLAASVPAVSTMSVRPGSPAVIVTPISVPAANSTGPAIVINGAATTGYSMALAAGAAIVAAFVL